MNGERAVPSFHSRQAGLEDMTFPVTKSPKLFLYKTMEEPEREEQWRRKIEDMNYE